jgi:hypothetical protein
MFVKKVMPFSKNAAITGQHDIVGLKRETRTIGNVHDTTSMLHDTAVRVMFHFTDAVEHAIAGDTGVGVDDENVVADADVSWRCQLLLSAVVTIPTCSPCPAFILCNHLVKSVLESLVFGPLSFVE